MNSIRPCKSLALNQFFRYCCIGLVLNACFYLIYLFATYLQVAPKVCMTILYIIGVVSSVLANRKWTFNSDSKSLFLFIRAAIVYLGGYLINLSLLYCFVDTYGYPHQLIQFLAVGIVAVYLFLALKFFVFNTASHPELSSQN